MTPALKQLWGWIVPWLVGALLAAAAVLGLFIASGAGDNETYVAGFALTALCLIALGWSYKNYLDGHDTGLPIPILVEDTNSLLVLIAVLAALAVAGLFLAAYGTGAAAYVGYGMFGTSLAFISGNLKYYFDRRDRAP